MFLQTLFETNRASRVWTLPLFELPGVLVRLNHVASCIENPDHSAM
jgi:hypothetical protein